MTSYLDLAEIFLRIIEKDMSKPIKRRRFTKSAQIKILKLQKNRCNICENKLDIYDLDHIDGDSSNNSLSNCQALCLDCHAQKSRNLKQKRVKLSRILRSWKNFLKNS